MATRSRSRKTQVKGKAERYEIGGHCSTPEVAPRVFDPGVSPNRARLIRVSGRKWTNHTVLHYCFLDEPAIWRGSNDDKDAVRQAFQEWKDLPIGLDFDEVGDAREAEIRIGFFHSQTAPDGGSWSYIGRDSIDLVPDPTQRTMNFGWALTDEYGYDTALHEIGHALGFPHEHQNPNAGIAWNVDAVYDYFTGWPNFWTRAQTERNVLNKLPQSEVEGSEWDPNSIMHYQFQAGLIEVPGKYRNEPLIPAPGLSETDKDLAKTFYPAPAEPEFPELRPYEAHRIRIEPGAQLDFVVRPAFSRTYTIQTFGQMDTVMVLFEEIGGQPRYVAGDDDSGWDFNARIRQRLFRGRTYYVRLRLYYAESSGEGALMMY